MNVFKGAFCPLLLLCILGFVIGKSSNLLLRLVERNGIPDALTDHVIVKRQASWNTDCPFCGYSAKDQPTEEGKIVIDKRIYSYDSFKTSRRKSILSDKRCKDAPTVSLCLILKRALGGYRG